MERIIGRSIVYDNDLIGAAQFGHRSFDGPDCGDHPGFFVKTGDEKRQIDLVGHLRFGNWFERWFQSLRANAKRGTEGSLTNLEPDQLRGEQAIPKR